jgi:hypothetical protein
VRFQPVPTIQAISAGRRKDFDFRHETGVDRVGVGKIAAHDVAGVWLPSPAASHALGDTPAADGRYALG